MATYYSGWVATDDWRIRMDCASSSPANSTTGTVYVHCAIESRYGVARYGAQVVITVAGQSQTVRTGAISTGATSWADQVAFTVGRGHSATGVSISARATCPESGVSAYQSGTSVAGSETLAAVTSHTTTYDGNGGTVSGAARQTQTKWYGTINYVPSYTMARDGYGFLGWGTASDSTTASYVAGQAYGLDIDQTLYAVWKRLYIAPTISGLSVVRAGEDGTEDNEGTYAAVSLAWAVDTTLDESNVASSVTVAWKEHGSDADFGDEAALATTGTTSGTATGTVGDGGFDTAKSYQVRVTVADSGGSSQSTTILSPSFFTIDLAAGGKGIGLLEQAPSEGLAIGTDAVTIADEAVGDWVVSQGATNGWLWRKWRSGIGECFTRLTGTTNSSGQHHWVSTFPFSFVSKNGIDPAVASASGGATGKIDAWNGYLGLGNNYVDTWINNGGPNNSCWVQVHVIGYYK